MEMIFAVAYLVVGLYIGNGLIVHASTEAAYPVGGIKTSPFDFATIRAIVRYW